MLPLTSEEEDEILAGLKAVSTTATSSASEMKKVADMAASMISTIPKVALKSPPSCLVDVHRSGAVRMEFEFDVRSRTAFRSGMDILRIEISLDLRSDRLVTRGRLDASDGTGEVYSQQWISAEFVVRERGAFEGWLMDCYPPLVDVSAGELHVVANEVAKLLRFPYGQSRRGDRAYIDETLHYWADGERLHDAKPSIKPVDIKDGLVEVEARLAALDIDVAAVVAATAAIVAENRQGGPGISEDGLVSFLSPKIDDAVEHIRAAMKRIEESHRVIKESVTGTGVSETTEI